MSHFGFKLNCCIPSLGKLILLEDKGGFGSLAPLHAARPSADWFLARTGLLLHQEVLRSICQDNT